MYLLLVPALPLVAGIVVLLGPWRRPRWLMALGWLALWTLPALAYQTWWWVSPESRYSVDLVDALRAAPVGLWVLLGGRSVITVFELITENLTTRQSTMVDNVHIFFLLTALQTGILAWILVRTEGLWRREKVALWIGIAVLINALLASHWPYWGS